jgi:hypothetical protein
MFTKLWSENVKARYHFVDLGDNIKMDLNIGHESATGCSCVSQWGLVADSCI